jgi:hypothetical protein
MSIVDEVRKKLNMEDDKDVAVWECLMEIQKTPQADLINGMVEDMRKEVTELEEQIDIFEKMRIKNLLTNDVLTKQAGEILAKLREERDELKQTLQSEAYKGVGGRPGSNSLETRRRT